MNYIVRIKYVEIYTVKIESKQYNLKYKCYVSQKYHKLKSKFTEKEVVE